MIAISDDISEKAEITNLGLESADDFIFGQLCSYELQWPESVVNENTMIVRAVQIAEGAEVYVTAGKEGITAEEALSEEKLTAGNEMNIRYPAKVYLTIKASDQGLDSGFAIQASFSPTVGDDDPITDDGRDVSNTTKIINQENNEETKSDVALILLIILILTAAAVIAVVCVYNKRKQAGKGCCSKKVPIDPKINPAKPAQADN